MSGATGYNCYIFTKMHNESPLILSKNFTSDILNAQKLEVSVFNFYIINFNHGGALEFYSISLV